MRVFNFSQLRNALTILPFLFYSISPTTVHAFKHHRAWDKAWFVGVGGGASQIRLNNSTSVANGSTYPAPSNQDSFTINTPSTGIVQFNVGYVAHSKAKTIFPLLSAYLQYRHYFSTNIRGNID